MGCSAIDWSAVGWTLVVMLLLFMAAGFIAGAVNAYKEDNDEHDR